MENVKKQKENHALYEKFTGLYEICFKPFFIGAIKKTMVKVKELKATDIIEVGVGTGYSLEHYPEGVNLTGLDVSDKMVKLSRKRAFAIDDKNIEIYNATDLPKDALEELASIVVSFSVITVVPDPQVFINSLKGYCKPGGHIILIMHSRGNGLGRVFDKIMDYPTRWFFGFTLLRNINDYDLSGLEILEIKPISRFFFYPYNHQIVLRKLASEVTIVDCH